MLVFLVIGCVTAAVVLATATSRPATDATRSRSAARRAKFVAANPTHVNSADIVAALRHEGISTEQARLIAERAQEQGIKPFTLWLWCEQFGAEALSIVVAADVTHQDLLAHISNGTLPDLEELKLFASVNGLDLDGAKAAARKKPAATSVKPTKRPPMPQIFEPGVYPGLEVPSRRSVSLRDNVERDGGRGGLAA